MSVGVKRGISLNRCSLIFCTIVISAWRETLQSSVIIVRDESHDPCFGKFYTAKRLSENHVRRNVRCERVEDCHGICQYERAFVCQGFNYGRIQEVGSDGRASSGDNGRGSLCQLTAVSGSAMDPRRDFVDDSRYDYYERDRTCHQGDGRSSIRDRTFPSGERFPVSHLPRRPVYNEIAGYWPPRVSTNDWNNRYYYRATPGRIANNFPTGVLDGRQDWRHRQNLPTNQMTQWSNAHRVMHYGGSYGYANNYPESGWQNYYPRTEASESSRNKWRFEGENRRYGSNYSPAYGYPVKPSRPIDNYDRFNQKPQTTRPDSIARGSSIRSLAGFKISRNIIVASCVAENLEDCQMLCSSRSDCSTFAYRYWLAATDPTDNCLVSNVSFEQLDFYTDLEPDRDYDIYAITGRNYDDESKRGSIGVIGSTGRPFEECFWRVGSGCEIPKALVREKIRTNDGLGGCQIACLGSRHFTCRSFVFRYASGRHRDANCFLSDRPTSEIISEARIAGSAGTDQDREGELYERASYGQGCEANPFSTVYDIKDLRAKQAPKPSGCYSSYDNGCKLTPYAVSSMTRVNSELECRRRCSIMRRSKHSPPCVSFSFKLGDDEHGDNCYLSDVPRRDLRPGLDYTYDDRYAMYSWKDLEPGCQTDHNPWQNSLDNRGPVFSSYNDLYLGQQPIDLPRPDPSNPLDYSGPTSSSYDNSVNDDNSSGYADGFANFNRRYTVNGYPCKRGTKCEINAIAGFWSCEPEGSEIGSWDYCCEPEHHCGYSRGYSYPWCYVGSSQDQWRPCSEEYYPYLPSPRPGINGHTCNEDVPSIQRPCLNHRARYWPVAYLHPVPPPNTTDSTVLANDRRDFNHFNGNASATNEDRGKNLTDDFHRANTSSSSSQMINSPIIRIRTRENRLSRRGSPSLLSNRNNNGTKNNKEAEVPSSTPSSLSKKFNERRDNDNSTETHNTTDSSDRVRFSRLGRIERVTKINNRVHVDIAGR